MREVIIARVPEGHCVGVQTQNDCGELASLINSSVKSYIFSLTGSKILKICS